MIGAGVAHCDVLKHHLALHMREFRRPRIFLFRLIQRSKDGLSGHRHRDNRGVQSADAAQGRHHEEHGGQKRDEVPHRHEAVLNFCHRDRQHHRDPRHANQLRRRRPDGADFRRSQSEALYFLVHRHEALHFHVVGVRDFHHGVRFITFPEAGQQCRHIFLRLRRQRFQFLRDRSEESDNEGRNQKRHDRKRHIMPDEHHAQRHDLQRIAHENHRRLRGFGKCHVRFVHEL